MEGKDETIVKNKYWIIGGAVIIGLWVVNLFVPYLVYFKDNPCNVWESIGQFGDQFGAVNALFSGFALLFIVITLFYQTKQLKLQRDDLRVQQEMLKETIEENKKQTQEYEKQVAEMRLQRLEVTLYDLAHRFIDSVDHQKLRKLNTASVVSPDKKYNQLLNEDEGMLFSFIKQLDYIINFINRYLGHDEDDYGCNQYLQYLSYLITVDMIKLILFSGSFMKNMQTTAAFMSEYELNVTFYRSVKDMEFFSERINMYNENYPDYSLNNYAETYLKMHKEMLNKKAEASE